MAIAKDEGTEFNIHVVGNTTGKTWSGSFKAKERLSFSDRLNMDQRRRNLAGPNPQDADSEALSIATMIAELSVRLIDSPEFWKESKGGMELMDENLLIEVYQKAREVERLALERLTEAGEEAKKELREQKETK